MSETSEMVERVARAIATAKRAPERRTPEIIDRAWVAYCGQARAAIAAMMEPSEPMKHAAIAAFVAARAPVGIEERRLSREKAAAGDAAGRVRRVDAEDLEQVSPLKVGLADLEGIDLLEGRTVVEHLSLVWGTDGQG